jgi:hypothetical protein
LTILAAVCIGWFLTNSADYAFVKVADIVTALIESHISESPAPTPVSEQDKAEIAQQVAALLQKEIASEKVQSIYHAIYSDRSITAVGASPHHAQRPRELVQRPEFSTRAGMQQMEEQQVISRTKDKEMVVTLISPVLLDGSSRRWRVAGPDGEFGASMKDEVFLKSLTQGQVKIPMVANIQMDIILQTKEVLKDGICEIKERDIIKVKSVSQPAPDPQLDFERPS